MQWILLLLTLAGCFGGAVSFHLHRKTERLKFMGLFWASLFFVAVNLALLLEPVFVGGWAAFIIDQIKEWGTVYCIALILSSLLLYVRESKPEFSRFPLFYVAFPLVIVISYLLVYDTVLLKNWLLGIYQGGAAVVAVLMYGIYFYRESMYQTPFIGALLFLITYLMYMILPLSYNYIWQISLFVSIITIFSGHLIVERKFEEQFQ